MCVVSVRGGCCVRCWGAHIGYSRRYSAQHTHKFRGAVAYYAFMFDLWEDSKAENSTMQMASRYGWPSMYIAVAEVYNQLVSIFIEKHQEIIRDIFAVHTVDWCYAKHFLSSVCYIVFFFLLTMLLTAWDRYT